MERVYKFLKDAGMYYLATMDGDQPRVRPFGTVLIFEGKLYIQTGKKKDCSRQIAENNKVEICTFHKGAWIRIAGELQEDDRVEAKKAMLDAYPNLRRMYDEHDDNTQVLYFKDASPHSSPTTDRLKPWRFIRFLNKPLISEQSQDFLSIPDEVLGFSRFEGMPTNHFPFVGTHFKTHLGFQRDGSSFGFGSSNRGG